MMQLCLIYLPHISSVPHLPQQRDDATLSHPPAELISSVPHRSPTSFGRAGLPSSAMRSPRPQPKHAALSSCGSSLFRS